ncbi:tripartite tricarboxylate transporter substrate binding protein [Diaphorobacter ruginosibacter]|nr:tripartite tricarboxylate transporter substrate binding protein [Diaphorobacter ruginosibacter]
MMNRRQWTLSLAALPAALATTPMAAMANEGKPVTIVVPYAAGGTTDMLGRLLAKELAPLLRRTIIVDNKPGAGSAIGAAYVAKAPADGSVLLVATSTTLAINPSLYRKLPYDPARDFVPVGMIGAVPLAVVTHASVPARTLEELVALSRSRREGLSYGSAGNGSPQHLAAEMLKAATGARLNHVPYKGSALAVTDLLGQQIDVMFSDIAPVLQHVKSGRLRALAVTSPRRQASMPDVPAVAESGIKGTADFDAVAWQSLVAPAGTSRELVGKMAAALSKVMSEASVRAQLARDGLEPGSIAPEQLAEYIRSETARWAAVVRFSGATVD